MVKLPSTKSVIIWTVLIGLSLFTIHLIFLYFDYHPSTDNAYVQANVIDIAPQITGKVENVFVKDNQYVQAKQLLFSIDAKSFQIALNKAKANVIARESALTLAKLTAGRTIKLVQKGEASKAAGDQAAADLSNAEANLDTAKADLAKAELDLQHTQITAPQNGLITRFVLRPGNNVIANNTLFELVEQQQFWVEANYKETQIKFIRPGQEAKIEVDMYPSVDFLGVVDSISSASGAQFALLPPENASGNWVKVTQRIPVKILFKNVDQHYPLRAGSSASVTVNTSKKIHS